MKDNLEDTQPNPRHSTEADPATRVSPSSAARQGRDGEKEQGAAQRRRAKRRKGRFSFLRAPWMQVLFFLVLALILVTAASGAAGWSVGRGEFNATATIQTGLYMFEQYNLALADMEAGHFELARQRLEFIFIEDPEFLDVAEKWVEVMLVLGQTSVPSEDTLPTASPTPTVDPRPKEELMAAAQALIAARDWTAAIDTLLALRKTDTSYHTVNVDGMLYLALRNRGVQNILEFGLFEPGLYDFSLAENFGPLDGQALNYQGWARLYLYGNAFWFAYPQEAAYYYGQLVGLAPDLRDSSGLSAFYRYWQSLVHYADQLAAEDWCNASAQYEVALNARNDANLQATADHALEQCILLTPSPTYTSTSTSVASATWTSSVSLTPTLTGSPTPTGSPTETPTPSATGSGPTETATPSPTPSETPTPSDTPPLPSEIPTPSETAASTDTPTAAP